MTRAVLAEVPPAFESVPAAHSSFGQDAVDLAASAGLYLDPWQVYALDRILGEHADGRPSAFEAALIVPRQNGKGSVLEALSLAWLYLTDAPLILHSAHEFKTAAEAFRRLRSLIMGAPHLAEMVERVTTAAGNEAIELTTGQRLRYVARSKGSGRGFTAGKVILDEAYALSDDEMAALIPTMATQPDAQMLLTSSAGMASSSYLRAVRDRGRKGGDPGLCYLEWGGVVPCPDRCAHELDDAACAMNDPALWARHNPSMGIRGHGIPVEFVASERRALPADVFARERLGLWDEADRNAPPFTLHQWQALADENAKSTSPPVFAVDLAPHRGAGAVAAATRMDDGAPLLEVVARCYSAAALVEEVAALAEANPGARWCAASGSAMESVVPELRDLGVRVDLVPPREVAAACGLFQDDVTEGRLVHLGDERVEAAILGAARRDVGDGAWIWTRRRSDADITDLYAMTLARWALPPVYDLSQSFG